MHMLGDDQRRHKKGRTSAEKTLKSANMLVLAVQFCCFLIVLAQTFIGGSNTFEGSFWIPRDFELKDVLAVKTSNCSYTGKVTIEGYRNIPVTLNAQNHGRMIVDTAGEIRFALIIYILSVGAGALNKLIFDVNLYHLIRIRHLVVHKELLSATELVLVGFSIQQCWKGQDRAYFLVDYFKHCGLDNTTTLFHTLPFIALYIGQAVVLFSHMLTLLILIYNACFAEKIGGVSAYDTPEGQLRLEQEKYDAEMAELQAQEAEEEEVVDADAGPPSNNVFVNREAESGY